MRIALLVAIMLLLSPALAQAANVPCYVPIVVGYPPSANQDNINLIIRELWDRLDACAKEIDNLHSEIDDLKRGNDMRDMAISDLQAEIKQLKEQAK